MTLIARLIAIGATRYKRTFAALARAIESLRAPAAPALAQAALTSRKAAVPEWDVNHIP